MVNNILLMIRFDRATVQYTESFEVQIDGPLWPRELEAISTILKIYKEQSKIASGHKGDTIK